MTWKESQCDLIWQQIVIAREHSTCEICGSHNNVQAHHIIFRSVCPKQLRYVTKLGVCLCDDCHLHRNDAPHQDDDKFLKKYLKKLKLKDRDRYIYISTVLKTVHQFSSSGVDIDRAYEDLKVECACVSNTAWIEADIEPEYGMTLIPESNRIT